jgi:peptidoglycan/xylan/chitin deacetylase (PgdA/CDA1 family)
MTDGARLDTVAVMRTRLGSVMLVLLLVAGVMVLPAGAAASESGSESGSGSGLVVEWDASVPVGVEAFVRGVAPVGASGVRVEVLGVDGWVESGVGVLGADGGFEVLLSFGGDVVGVYTFRVVVDTVDGEVLSEELVVTRTAVSEEGDTPAPPGESEPPGEPEPSDDTGDTGTSDVPATSGDEAPTVEEVEPVTVSATNVPSRPVGVLTRVWGRVNGFSGGEVFTEVDVAGEWIRSEATVSDATGYYQIPLTYGANAVGTYTYRVGATTPDGTVYSNTFTLTRTLSVTVSAANAGSRPVGVLTRVWGRVNGYTGGRVFTEVMTSNGWSRSQIATSDATGYYQIPLTYGSNTVGAYTWRVGAITPAGTAYSDPFQFTRTATLSASSVRSSPVGSLATVSGRVGGYSGGRVFTEVMTSNGWSRSQTVTSSPTGYYQIPLTYGANTLGTYTYRVGAGTPVGTVYSATFTITRTPRTPPRTLHLSFDDGPNSVYTAQLLSLLARYDAKATFFPVGSQVSSGSSLLRRAVADGHRIGNHTWSHPSLAGISEARFRSEIISSQNAIATATGVRPRCLRPPYGAMDSRTAGRAAALGLSIKLWSVDPQDWRRPGANTIASRVIQSARSGSVVVMHDGGGNRSQTVAAVGQILAYFSARGYSFTPIPGC